MYESPLPPGLVSEKRCGVEPRKNKDRRELIRFEPQRAPRRQGRDRRRHYGWGDLPQR